jgi:uncharacterized protein (DUF983 family)
MMSEPDLRDLPPLLRVGIKGRCPHCDSADGPAAFIMMIAGAVVLGSALITDAYYEPPLLVLAAIFLPLMLIVSLGLMRPAKGLLIASQYRNKAAQIINPD